MNIILDINYKMNATNRLDLLLNDTSISNNRMNQETSIQPLSKLTFPERDSYPSTVLPSVITTTLPLPPRRNSSSMKHHRRRQPIDQTDKQNPYQPLLNSSTLDDLFRALTLECEQYLAATSSYQNKTYDEIIVQPSSNIQTTVESNDEDYENLHPLKSLKPIINNFSPLKTSIQVISPIKRHVVSITVSSKISSPIKTPCITTKSIDHSSEEDSINKLSSNTNRKHRRRRTRKQFLPSPTTIRTRSSSSSTERKEIIIDKKPMLSKRSCSTDPRYQCNKNSYENNSISSSQKQLTRRPRRRDISLQHNSPISERFHGNSSSSPLSILLTSTKSTSDFLDNSHQRQERRSRLESVNHKSSTLLDRMHQQFYQPSSIRNNNNNNNNKNNILIHRLPSYPVY
jgi:hypothetical protein